MKKLFFILILIGCSVSCTQDDLETINKYEVATEAARQKLEAAEKEFPLSQEQEKTRLNLIDTRSKMNQTNKMNRGGMVCQTENIMILSLGFGFYEVLSYNGYEWESIGITVGPVLASMGWCNGFTSA